jgi:lipid A 4'-phosphatase
MRLLLGLFALTIVTLVVFALWPQFDLDAAHALFDLTGFRHTNVERAIRAFFRATPFVVLAVFVALYGLRRLGAPVPYAPSSRQLVFLIASMAIGPGLLINAGLKDYSHRPRPIYTREFGGEYEFRPWYRFDGGCRKNCSFASGEAATAAWMIAPASLVPPPAQPYAIAGALLFGAAASLSRLAIGHHFLSDVLVGALIALICVHAAHMILIRSRVLAGGVARGRTLPIVARRSTSLDPSP